jgi:hypothetical protein
MEQVDYLQRIADADGLVLDLSSGRVPDVLRLAEHFGFVRHSAGALVTAFDQLAGLEQQAATPAEFFDVVAEATIDIACLGALLERAGSGSIELLWSVLDDLSPDDLTAIVAELYLIQAAVGLHGYRSQGPQDAQAVSMTLRTPGRQKLHAICAPFREGALKVSQRVLPTAVATAWIVRCQVMVVQERRP